MTGVLKKNLSKMEITFLGQMGFKIRCGETVIYIDPFLSDHPKRQFPPPMSVEDLCDADLILGTHDHKDHVDRESWPKLAAASPMARFVVPELLLRWGLPGDLGISEDRFVGLNDGQSVEMDGVRVTGVASAHEFLDRDEKSGLYPYLGYIIECDGFCIYHAGDTCRYEGLEAKLSNCRFDLMMLPINGRDARRYKTGYIGNMTYQEAVDLAGVLRPRLVIPGHWDMFAHNGEDPMAFVDYMRVKYPRQNVWVAKRGKKIVLRGDDCE